MVTPAYHHGDLKNSLISAAIEQIEQDGAASLNLRALARAVGVTHPAVYRHFAGKEALLEAVAERGFTEFAAALATTVATPYDDRRARLFALTTTYIDFALAHPELTRVMFSLISIEARKKNASLYAATKKAYVILLQSVADTEGDAQVNSAVVWAVMHGLAQLTIGRQLETLGDAAERDAIIDKAVGILDKGFC